MRPWGINLKIYVIGIFIRFFNSSAMLTLTDGFKMRFFQKHFISIDILIRNPPPI